MGRRRPPPPAVSRGVDASSGKVWTPQVGDSDIPGSTHPERTHQLEARTVACKGTPADTQVLASQQDVQFHTSNASAAFPSGAGARLPRAWEEPRLLRQLARGRCRVAVPCPLSPRAREDCKGALSP